MKTSCSTSAGGSIAFRFHARDAHLVLSAGAREPIAFRVLLDGEAPGRSAGVDVDADGTGMLQDGRLYQLIRQHDGVRERTLEIMFLERGAEAYLVHVRLAAAVRHQAKTDRGLRARNQEVAMSSTEADEQAPLIDYENLPAPTDGILVTQFITVRSVARSRAFYSDVLGGQVVLQENPCIVKLANSWVLMNPGGPPTPDKPDISLVNYEPRMRVLEVHEPPRCRHPGVL